MRRRDLDYLVIAVMLVSGFYTAVTGLVADLFGLHQFVFHAYAGYVCAGAALVHIALNGRRAVSYLRRLGHRRPKTRSDGEERARRESLVGRRDAIIAAASAVGGLVVGWLLPDGRRGLPEDARDIGALYHRWSTPGHLLDLPAPDWGSRPSRYKTYPEAERVPLPEPAWPSGVSVNEALDARRSRRDYSARPLPPSALSALLHAAQGITFERVGFRAAPSAGALYPIEIYPVIHDADGIPPGVYHYAVQAHEIERLESGDFRGRVTRAGLYQAFLGEAGVCFLLSAVFQRTRWKYRERAYRYVLLEAGHVGQNIYLAATALGLGACAVGAFYDRQYNELLGLDGEEEAVLYAVSVGQLA